MSTLTICITLFQNCSPYHAADLPSNAVLDDENSIAIGQSLYENNCAACHGRLETSSILSRNFEQITVAVATVPEMASLRGLSTSQLEAISKAISNELGGGTVVINPEGRAAFLCEATAASKTPLLKLTNREYEKSIDAFLDSFSQSLKSDAQINQLFSQMPTDTIVQDRDTYKEQAKLVTETGTRSHFEIAYRASQLIASSSSQVLSGYPNTNSCLSASNVSNSCFRLFIAELASRGFRRPVTTSEVNDLVSRFWDSTNTKAQRIQMAVLGVLQSPDFLYKAFDRGAQEPNTVNTLNLTAHEFTAKISYLLTGGPPDSQLRGLANNGSILTLAVLDQQIERLLNSAAARPTISRLFRESYGYDYYDGLDFSSSFRAGINTNGLRESMNFELDEYFSNLVLDRDADFNELMTSRLSTVNSQALATIYDTNTGANQNLPVARSGFLNRAAMLTKRSGSRASPIKRGLSVLEHVLCDEVGLPPPSAPTSLPDFGNEVVSTREATFRTSEVQGTSCVTCHSRINNLGYPYENFDSLGRLRTQEAVYNANGAVERYLGIDTAVSTSSLSLNPQNFSDSVALAHGIGQSDVAMMCFVRHLKRFESRGREQSSDSCQMNEVLEVMYNDDPGQRTVKGAIKSLIKSDSFKKWSY